MLSCFSRVQLFATPSTVANRLFCPWNSPDKNTGVKKKKEYRSGLPFPS